jgi:hypothetical protein
MSPQRPRAYRADRPSLADEPKYFTRVPDDALEDPRLTDTTLRVFSSLLKGNTAGEKVLFISRDELARVARRTTRCVLNELIRLEGCGYIRRERDRSRRGAPHCIVLCYELRPALKLESGPAIVTGSRRASNRNGGSDCNRNRRSDCNRNGGSGPTMFEERNVRETTTLPVVEDSSSFSQSSIPENTETQTVNPIDPEPAEDPPDDPESPEVGQLIAAALEHWPQEPNLAARVRKLAAQGLPETGLAIEYAALRKAKGFGYVASTVARWWNDGWDLVDIQAEVWSARPRARKPDPVVIHRRPDPLPVDPEVAALVSDPKWFLKVPQPEKEPAAGQSGNFPRGRLESITRSPDPCTKKHTGYACSRQEFRESEPDGLLALESSTLPSQKEPVLRLSPDCPP